MFFKTDVLLADGENTLLNIFFRQGIIDYIRFYNPVACIRNHMVQKTFDRLHKLLTC